MTESTSVQDGEPAAPPAKVDPEALALRAQPPRAERFKRGAVIGIAAVVSTGLVATAWVALQPSALQIAGGDRDNFDAAKNVPTDALASLPQTYGNVPKLGPPLPGDLGRPILRKQQMTMATEDGTSNDVARAADAESDRRAAERRAALESPLLVRSTSPSQKPIREVSGAQPALQPFSPPTINAPHDPNNYQRNTDFVASTTATAINAHRIEHAQSPYTLSAGSVIAASLLTGVRSDLPGLVTAQVSEQVYDSATGSILLIPQGARLIGSYNSVVAFGQRRALIVWQRLILPDGASLTIENVPATDPSGFSGLADQVDFHTWSLLKGAALSTLLGVGSNLTFSGESDLVRAIRESTQQNTSRAGDQLVSKNLGIQPTITIRPGASVRLVVHRDLILKPWKS